MRDAVLIMADQTFRNANRALIRIGYALELGRLSDAQQLLRDARTDVDRARDLLANYFDGRGK